MHKSIQWLNHFYKILNNEAVNLRGHAALWPHTMNLTAGLSASSGPFLIYLSVLGEIAVLQ